MDGARSAEVQQELELLLESMAMAWSRFRSKCISGLHCDVPCHWIL